MLYKITQVETAETGDSILNISSQVGAAVSDIKSISVNGSMIIRPPSSVTWLIELLLWDGAVKIFFQKGSRSIRLKKTYEVGSLENTMYRITNSFYIVIRNWSGTTRNCGYSGYVVEESS